MIFAEHIIAVNPFVQRMPSHLKEEFKDDLGREIASGKIHFRKNIDNNQQEYSILDRYHILVAYFRKPFMD